MTCVHTYDTAHMTCLHVIFTRVHMYAEEFCEPIRQFRGCAHYYRLETCPGEYEGYDLCDMTHSHLRVWHDSFTFVTRLNLMRVMWLVDMCDMSRSHTCDMTRSHVGHGSILCMWCVCTCAMLCTHVRHDSVMCETSTLSCVCDMAHPFIKDSYHTIDVFENRMWYDSFTYGWVMSRTRRIRCLTYIRCMLSSGIHLIRSCSPRTVSYSIFDWCCFHYLVRNSLVSLLQALCARLKN